MNLSVRKLLMWKPIGILIVIFLFAFFLRAQELISGNYLFLIDQGRDMMAVKGIVFEGKPTLIGPYTSLQGVFQGPLWYYLLAVPTVLFDGNPIGALWLMLLTSLAAVVMSYIWMGKQFGAITGLAAAFLFAFSPQAIAAATFAWNPHPMWFLVLLYIFFFYNATHKNKKAYLLSFPLITLMSHFETALAVFLGVSSIFYLGICVRSDFKSKFVWLGLLLSVVFFLPQIVFDLRHNFLMTNSVLKIFAGSNQGLTVSGEELNYASRIITHGGVLFNNFKYSFPQLLTDNRLSILIFIVVLTGIVAQLKKRVLKKASPQEFLRFLTILLGINWVIMVFIYLFPIRAWFLTGFEVFYILITATLIGVYAKHKVVRIALVVLVALVLLSAAQRIHFLYFVSTDTGGIHKNKGKLEAIDYIYKDAKSKDFGLLIFTPPVYTYAYDYLIWWRSKTEYGYIPPPEKKETFYLLMEEDSGNPVSHKGWMKTVVKTGDTINTVNLPSGLIVEKRTNTE